MTQEEKDILLRDLCARLPYGVICRYEAVIPLLGEVLNYGPLQEIRRKGEYFIVNGADCLYEDVKPYLRPMESMTDEERKGLTEKGIYIDDDFDICQDAYEGRNISLKYVVSEYTDWLNKKQFDYRGLISMGLALETPEGMYKTV